MQENLEVIARLLAEVTSVLIALAVLISKLTELEAQIRVNRQHIQLHSDLLSELTHNLKAFVCDRHDNDEQLDSK